MIVLPLFDIQWRLREFVDCDVTSDWVYQAWWTLTDPVTARLATNTTIGTYSHDSSVCGVKPWLKIEWKHDI